jgi:cystine transport system substrate-binding protein
MKALCVWFLCLLCLVFGIAETAPAADPEEIVIVFFYGGYAPFYMEGLEEGIYVDFITAFDEQSAEFMIKLEPLSRKRIDQAMDQGDVQASGVTNPMFVGEKQAKSTLFTNSIWTTGNYIVMHKDAVFEYAKPEDLAGKKLGVIYGNRNAGLDPLIEAGEIKAMPVRTNEGLYQALLEQKVDAIVINKHVLLYELKLNGIDASQFVIAETPVSEFDLMTQIQPTHQHFLDALNAFIETSKQDGLLEQINKKYLE